MKKQLSFVVLTIIMIASQLVSAQYSATITSNPNPANICAGQGTNVSLTANGFGGIVTGYLWSTGSALQAINVSPASTTPYSVTVTFLGGFTAVANQTVTVFPVPTPTITPGGPTTFCLGGAVTLNSSASSLYQWYLNGASIAGANAASYPASVAGNYSVMLTNGNGCSATSATTTVTVNPLPTVTVTPGGPTTFCLGGSVVLTSSAAVSYQWYLNGVSIFGATASTHTALVSGNYSVTITDGNGCSATSANTSVTVNPLPVATITPGGPTTFCQGGLVILTSSAAVSYQWNLGGVIIPGATAATYSASVSGSYSVTVTNGNGCVATSANTTVTVNPLPVATITPGGPTTFCQGGLVILTSSAAVSYQWYLGGVIIPGATAATYSASVSGSYSVTVTNGNGCVATSANTTVTVNPLPVATITPGGPTTFCLGGNVILTSSAAASYQWYLNGTIIAGATAGTYSAIASGNYSVNITDINGCSATSANTTVTVNSLPTAVITPSGPTTFCFGGSVVLISNVNNAYLWNTGATTQFITVITSGTYSVVVTNGNGCTATATIVVTVNPLPTATVTPSGPTTFCQGGVVTLNSIPAASYLWNSGATTQSINVSTSGSHSLSIVDANGCSSAPSAATVVTVNPLPTATVTPSGATTFCQGGVVTLTASAGTSHLWSTGAITSSIVVSTSGNYSVTVTNSNGCSATSAVTTVTVNPLPIAVITPSGATTFCQGGAVSLTSSSASSYVWSTGAVTQSIVASVSGNNSVTITDANGCSATSAVTTVTVNPLPIATVTPSGATTFCQGGSVTLTSSVGTSYVWSNGAVTQSIVVLNSGNYSVTVTDVNGCSATSVVTPVTVNPLPIVSITPSGATTFCSGGSVTLTASLSVSYVWSTGATTQSIVVLASGNYFVMGTNGNGCSATSATTTVTVNPLPIVSITPSGATTFCFGGSVNLTASAATSYLWSTGATTQTITVSSSSNYFVMATNTNGCSATASITITVNPLPIATVTPSGPTTFCSGGNVTLTSTPASIYLWSNSANTQSTTVSTAGNYSVTITDANGCSATSAVTVVTVNPLPTVVITPSGATTFCFGGSVTLTATAATSYLWSTTATTQSIVASVSGNYSVTATNSNGCSAIANSLVLVNPLPQQFVISGSSSTFCQGTVFAINQNGSQVGMNYQLMLNGSPIGIPMAGTGFALAWTNQISAGIYTVVATDTATTCTNPMNGSAVVTMNPLPASAGAITGSTTLCQGSILNYSISAVLNATSYTWSVPTGAIITSGQGTSTIQVNFMGLTSGNVGVFGQNTCGAGQPSLLAITVNQAPSLIVTATSTDVCAGGNTTLSANGNGNIFLWSTTAITQTITVSPIANTTYTVTSTGTNGCSATGTISVAYHASPVVTLSLVQDNFCTDLNTALLSGGSPLGGVFSGSAVFSTSGAIYPPVSGVGTTLVTYTLTDGWGCIGSATDLLTINPVPTVLFSSIIGAISTTTSAFDLMPNVSPTGGVFSGPGMTGSQFNPATAGPGTHTIVYTYTNGISGCSATQIQFITVTGMVGINEVSAAINAIHIFPNPATDNLNLSGISKEIKSLSIVNVLGAVVYTAETVTENMQINVSSFNPGTYIVSFVNAEGISSGKYFIKTNWSVYAN